VPLHRISQETRIVVLVLFASTLLFAADKSKRDDIPPAPLPKQIVEAKRVFLAKGAGADRALRDGDELAFDAFYAEMKDWGRFELVDSPEQAEVVLELSYSSPPAARSRARDPRLTAKFYDPKTGHVLWTASEERNKAVFCKTGGRTCSKPWTSRPRS